MSRMSRTMARVGTRTALATAASAIAVIGLAAAVPAGASASVAAPASASVTAACGPSNASAALLGSASLAYFCGVGSYPVLVGPFTILSINVPNRIWLHQDRNGGGWGDCFSGTADWVLSGRDRSPGNLQISANTAPC